ASSPKTSRPSSDQLRGAALARWRRGARRRYWPMGAEGAYSWLRARLPAAIRGRDYFLLWSALVIESFGIQMVAVAIGWQVYGLHHSAFDLGLIGLAEFVPLLVLALPVGQLADRVSRRLLFTASLALSA